MYLANLKGLLALMHIKHIFNSVLLSYSKVVQNLFIDVKHNGGEKEYMKTNKIIWAKTMLFAYKYLEAMCNSIDKIIGSIATGSFYHGGAWDDSKNCYNISRKIIRLSDKKIDYINLKVIIEKALNNIDKTYAKILILRNIKELSVATICSLLNFSERTFFRKINLAERSFMCEIEKLGFNIYNLEIKYLCDEFIRSIYNIFSEEKTTYENVANRSFNSNIIFNYLRDFARFTI